MPTINPAKMKPPELTRLLNSTPLGTVMGERQVYRHMNRAGFRISDDGRSVNLVKYLSWLVDLRHDPTPARQAMDYEAMKEAARARNLAKSRKGRDIAPLPEVVDPERKKMCERNFRLFCESYFPETFSLAWSDDHLKVISKIEQAVLHGGLFAMAMPRGSGKALALDTPLVTPIGWTTMGKVKVGDTLFDEQGHQCRVLSKSPVFTDHKCFRVTFNDGEEIVCDAGHLWQVEDIFGRKNPYVRKTEWLSSRYKIGKCRFQIPMQKSILVPANTVRTIIDITQVSSVPVQCVTVDSPSHLYLVGRKMVPTHNSSVSETACLWAMFYGHRDFVALISATETAALEMLSSIKTELESNEQLLEDFPEVVYPICSLDGISNKCPGQLCDGKRTRIKWTSKEIVLPTINSSRASGAIIRVAGITGRIRGMKFKRPDKATPVRPSLVIIDDPQTSESANSLEQTRKRVRVLAGDVLGLAGPGQKISGIMPCTVIRMGDMADQILDAKTHPEWNGERTKMVYEFPVNEKLWDKYAKIRADSLRQHGDIRDATVFYQRNREEMDEGANIAWEDRFNHDEISAVQHAMNLKLQDEAAFWAEYQNEPKPEDLGEDRIMTATEIAAKLNSMKRGEVPVGCVYLTMFIDVQKELLYWLVAAWEDDFTGYVIDYGTYPEQPRRYFHLHEARPTLQDAVPGAGLEGCIYGGLDKLCSLYLNKEWRRDDGAMLKIDRCLIDANWGQSTDVVYQFCRQSTHSAILLPSHGRYVGASSKPFSDYRRQPGDRIGHNWMIPNVRGKRAIRHLLFDANYWKSFIHSRLAVAMGDKGCLSLYGRDPNIHTLLSEHLTAEYRVKTEGRGRKVDEWKLRPEASDNHWLDGIVGAAVAASLLGANIPGIGESGKPLKQRRHVDLSQSSKKIFLSGERRVLNPPDSRNRLN